MAHRNSKALLCNEQKGANRLVSNFGQSVGAKYAGHILTARYLAYVNRVCLLQKYDAVHALVNNLYCCDGEAILKIRNDL